MRLGPSHRSEPYNERNLLKPPEGLKKTGYATCGLPILDRKSRCGLDTVGAVRKICGVTFECEGFVFAGCVFAG
jgi:hypothetical protein